MKGPVMRSNAAPTIDLSLTSTNEEQSFTRDPGSVSYSGEAAACMAAEKFCPMIEAFYEKDRQLAELEARLEESEERARHLGDLAKLGEMSAVIAHEIRNPLTGISATAEVLLDDIAPEDPRHESVSIILDEIQRLEKIVRNLLDFARNRKPFITRVDLREEIEHVLASVSHLASQHDVTISGSCADDLEDAAADAELVRQAFLNIALNAVQAMPHGGELAVKLYSDADGRGRCLRTAFIDTGCGISKEIMEKIFDPFFTTKTGGAGLGLAVSKKIIEAQRGSITVESRPGGGSIFIVTLPAADAADSASGKNGQ
ncbi:MAG TPA: ATP-binding protein [Planctomycetota bacterium]|nr:ATP-binding protein [Planctomycetota bacterium]